MAADEEGEEPEEESSHEPRLWPDGAGRSITCLADDLLAKDRISLVRLSTTCGTSSAAAGMTG